MNCIFCKMAAGEIKPDVVYEDDSVLAFRDQNPQAPTHVLVVPREHIETLNDVTDAQGRLIGRMYAAVRKIAAQEGIADSGFRTVFNCNAEGGQSVYHLHLHLLGGRPMSWPPG